MQIRAHHRGHFRAAHARPYGLFSVLFHRVDSGQSTLGQREHKAASPQTRAPTDWLQRVAHWQLSPAQAARTQTSTQGHKHTDTQAARPQVKACTLGICARAIILMRPAALLLLLQCRLPPLLPSGSPLVLVSPQPAGPNPRGPTGAQIRYHCWPPNQFNNPNTARS